MGFALLYSSYELAKSQISVAHLYLAPGILDASLSINPRKSLYSASDSVEALRSFFFKIKLRSVCARDFIISFFDGASLNSCASWIAIIFISMLVISFLLCLRSSSLRRIVLGKRSRRIEAKVPRRSAASTSETDLRCSRRQVLWALAKERRHPQPTAKIERLGQSN